MEAYSQYGQDLYCYDRFFKTCKKGIFLEIGADDGIDKSNTLFFEKMGWTGLCVEASPSRFALLQKNRRCYCENVAVYDRKSRTEFLDIRGWGKGLSGIIENYDQKHIERIGREICHPENRGWQIVDVQCMSINNLLQKYGLYQVDFCSIDTEGGELEILESLDMNRFKWDVVCVENNYDSANLPEFMKSKGFVLAGSVAIDQVFKRCRKDEDHDLLWCK